MSRFSDIPDHSFSNYRPSQMGRGEFATIFGNVFEHSAWIVMQAWNTGLTAVSYTHLTLPTNREV